MKVKPIVKVKKKRKTRVSNLPTTKYKCPLCNREVNMYVPIKVAVCTRCKTKMKLVV